MPLLRRILFALLCIPLLARAAAPSHDTDYRLIGYVAGWEAQPRIDAERLTAINYAFAHIVGGAVVLDAPQAREVLAQLRALKKRNPQLRILV